MSVKSNDILSSATMGIHLIFFRASFYAFFTEKFHFVDFVILYVLGPDSRLLFGNIIRTEKLIVSLIIS